MRGARTCFRSPQVSMGLEGPGLALGHTAGQLGLGGARRVKAPAVDQVASRRPAAWGLTISVTQVS